MFQETELREFKIRLSDVTLRSFGAALLNCRLIFIVLKVPPTFERTDFR